jgi:biopolymer transport protein ExbB/TolQ
MMHELLQRLAHFGGECALVILFILSVVNVAAISERFWYFWKRRLDIDDFASQLATLVRAGETVLARTVAEQSENSVCVIVLAALTQAGNGLKAARRALSVAISKERLRLRSKVTIFQDLGRCAILTGIAGTLFDLLAMNLSTIPDGAATESVGYQVLQLAIAALAPSAAGLAVAVPAFIASGIAKAHVERALLACDFVAQLLISQLPVSTPYRKHGDPHSKAA